MTKLDQHGERLLSLLVKLLPTIDPLNPRTFITYKDVHTKLGLQKLGDTYGTSLKHQGLSNLADWTESEEIPAITGMIIDGTNYTPGDGYFRLFGKTADDFHWWADQLRLSKQFDWPPFLPAVQPPPPPIAEDFTAPPPREEITTYRILRDTKISRRVKAIHKYECQICGSTIELPDGSRYAEAHHIRPLGGKHNGPDVAENILCLCPNHHAELDYAVRLLNSNQLKRSPGHAIGEEYIQYHNESVRKRKDVDI